MRERVAQELALIRQVYEGVEYRRQGDWFYVPSYTLPEDWNRVKTAVAFQVNVSYPVQPPYGFYVPAGICFQGKSPNSYDEPVGNAPPFDGQWGFSLGRWKTAIGSRGSTPPAARISSIGSTGWPRGSKRVLEMVETYLRISEGLHQQIWSDLLPEDACSERAGFLFVDSKREDDSIVFRDLEWFPVPPEGYEKRTTRHIELRDGVLAYVIKRAHDLDASIIEMHSHPKSYSARFSPFDQDGFEEIVPQVRWRLKGKPYGAIVVARASFDGLVWLEAQQGPQHVAAIVVDGITHEPTRLSSLQFGGNDE